MDYWAGQTAHEEGRGKERRADMIRSGCTAGSRRWREREGEVGVYMNKRGGDMHGRKER